MKIVQLKTIAAAALLAGAALFLQAPMAEATTCPTPGTAGVVRFLDLTTAPDPQPTCIDSGTEAGADGAFQTGNPGYDFIAKEEDGNDGLDGMVDGLIYSGGGYGLSGSIDFTSVAGFTDFVILFKLGHPATSESWFAFSIPSSAFSADWVVEDAAGDPWTGRGALSHVTLYGVPGTVPVPASLPLLAAGMLSLAALRRRRRTG